MNNECFIKAGDYMNKKKIYTVFEEMNLSSDNKGKLDRVISLHEMPNSPTKIVIFGKYNHGKSSFLNAWFEEDSLFSVSDKRETQEVQEEYDHKHNVIWFDTPGLDAEEADDLKAFEVLKEADLLCLVHSLADGELDKKEITFLKDNKSLRNKSVLLLTKLDQQEDYESVSKKINEQVESEGLKLESFLISSERYRKYINSGKKSKVFGRESGFYDLKEYLIESIAQVNKKRTEDLRDYASDLISILEHEAEKIGLKIEKISEQQEKEKKKVEDKINKIISLL